jgi:hydroxyacylglutathione hydrolase
VPSTIGIELASNPFLRADAPGVRAAAAARLGRPAGSSVEAFAAIREWKNVFR